MSAWRGGSGLVLINVSAVCQARLVMGLLTSTTCQTSRYVTIYTNQLSLPSLRGLSAIPALRQEYSAFIKFWLTSGNMLNIEQVEQYTNIFAT